MALGEDEFEVEGKKEEATGVVLELVEGGGEVVEAGRDESGEK